jgi:hypothetical protein
MRRCVCNENEGGKMMLKEFTKLEMMQHELESSLEYPDSIYLAENVGNVLFELIRYLRKKEETNE